MDAYPLKPPIQQHLKGHMGSQFPERQQPLLFLSPGFVIIGRHFEKVFDILRFGQMEQTADLLPLFQCEALQRIVFDLIFVWAVIHRLLELP